MDALSLFGLFAVTAMLACYALEDRSRGYILGFAAPARSARPTDSCKGPAVRAGRGGLGVVALAAGTSGGNDLAVFGQAGDKAPQRAVLVRAAMLDEKGLDPRLGRAQSVNADGLVFPTTARGSMVTPMSAATQPIMPSSVPSSNRAADGQPSSENTCSSRCR